MAWVAPGPRAPARSPATRCRASESTLEVEGDVQPIGSYVLLRAPPREELSRGGILLPPKQDKPRGGEVVSLGPGEADPTTGVLRPMELQPGSQVVCGRYGSSSAVRCGSAEHLLVRQDDVLC